MVKYSGSGRHVAFLEETEPSKLILMNKALLVVEFFYTAGITLPRLSILALYMRIFAKTIFAKGRIAVYTVVLIMVLFYIVTVLLIFLKCHPLAYMWDTSIPGGHCLNINESNRWVNLPNILIDVVILVLPFPVIWRLHISKNQKLGLAVTFLTGSM